MSKDRNHGDKVKQVFKVNTVSFQETAYFLKAHMEN